MIIIPISREIKRKEFNCGIEELNKYLRQFALPNDKRNIGKTFVAVDEPDVRKPLGFYTVSMAQIKIEELPSEIAKELPRYPVPSMRIGKLAVDSQSQGKRIGASLLKDALMRAIRISSEVALHFILVDAIDDTAKTFYMKYGFKPLRADSLTLILSLKTVEKALPNEQSPPG